MNINYINTGTSPNSGDGDSIRTAFSKVNSNLAAIANSLTNLNSLITAAGPTGPTGPSSSLQGTINTGTLFSIPYYTSGTILSPISPLTYSTSLSTLRFGGSIPTFQITRESWTPNGTGFLYTEHHEIADSSNFAFRRTRGTAANQLPLRKDDNIADIFFTTLSKNNSTVGIAGISVFVENTETSAWETGQMVFYVNPGIDQNLYPVVAINSSGTLQVDSLNVITTGSNLTVKTNLIPDNDLTKTIGSNSNRWNEGFLNVLNISSGITFSDGTTQTSAWTPSSNYGSRTTKSITTPPLISGELIDVTLDGFPGFVIYKITTSAAAWVRLYTSEAARAADASRIEGVSPPPNSGIIAEISSTETSTVTFLPAIYGFTDPPLSEIKANIVNKSVTTSSVTLSVLMIQTES